MAHTVATVVVWVCYVRDYTRVLIATALGVIRGRKFRQTEIPVPINLGDVDEWGVLFFFPFFFLFSCGAELHLVREWLFLVIELMISPSENGGTENYRKRQLEISVRCRGKEGTPFSDSPDSK